MQASVLCVGSCSRGRKIEGDRAYWLGRKRWTLQFKGQGSRLAPTSLAGCKDLTLAVSTTDRVGGVQLQQACQKAKL